VPYYTMPYIHGESLRARMATPLLVADALNVVRDIAAALAYAHAAGIVHRDIKPENVLLSGRVAMVADFGIAKAIVAAAGDTIGDASPASTLTLAGTSLGTPAYMAPEQVAGDTVGATADVYAWGLVAYEMFAGMHPFAGKTGAQQLMIAQIMEAPASIHDAVPDLPGHVADLVMRCLEKDPAARPQAGEELCGALAVTTTARRK
jgi:eukaryotic-like serine/threonine-protein kinase